MRVRRLSEIVQDCLALFTLEVKQGSGQVEAQYCGGETGYQGSRGAETRLVRISEADVEVGEAAVGSALGAGVRVVGLVG